MTGPEEVVAGLGSCVLIPCRYNLCQVGSSTRLPALRWLQKPVYDHDRRDYLGGLLVSTATSATSSRARIRLAVSPRPHPPTATTAYAEGDCSLVLSHVRAEDAGDYGLRLEANGSRSRHVLRWLHKVVLNVTGRDRLPAVPPPLCPRCYNQPYTSASCRCPPCAPPLARPTTPRRRAHDHPGVLGAPCLPRGHGHPCLGWASLQSGGGKSASLDPSRPRYGPLSHRHQLGLQPHLVP